jgi:heat shock protein HslJ
VNIPIFIFSREKFPQNFKPKTMKNRPWITLQVLAGAILIWMGCTHSKMAVGSGTTEMGTVGLTDSSLLNTHWKLISLEGKLIADSGRAREMYLILKKEDSRINGNGGCNSFSGTYTLTGKSSIAFGPLISTKMWCEGMDNETSFFAALSRTDKYSIKGDTLSLGKDGMAPFAKFIAVR